MGIDEPHMIFFCETYDLANLIKQPTVYKSPDNYCYTYIVLFEIKELVYVSLEQD